MSFKYPDSVKDHARELRRDFHIALASTKGVRTKVPISEHVARLIRAGIRKGFAEVLSQNKYSIFHSKQARREVEDMILSQISSELFGQMPASVIPDGISRATLRSLHASFDDLAHKYEAQAARLGATMHFAGANEHTAPASPAETELKMEAGSSSPPDWHQKPSNHVLNKADRKAIVVSLVNNLVGSGLNDVELTRLVNQSIGSDPDIPSHLRDSDWITGANLLTGGEIEVHTETEDDRDFLDLNTHWRPKLEQTLTAMNEMSTEAVDQFSFERSHSMLRAYEDSVITRVDDIKDINWEQDMVEARAVSPVLVPSSRPGQISQPFVNRVPWESEDDCSYIPHQGTHIFTTPGTTPSYPIPARAQSPTYTEPAGPIIRPQATSTETTIDHKKRGALFSSASPCSHDTTKRLKFSMDEQ